MAEHLNIYIAGLTFLFTLLTSIVVGLIGWSITRIVKSLDRAHIRIDEFEREVRKEFVSEVHCKSIRGKKD